MFESLSSARAPSSPFARRDPRVKILSSLAIVLFVVLASPTWPRQFASLLAIEAGLIILAGLSPVAVLRRSLVVVPFVLLVAITLPFFQGGESVAEWGAGPVAVSVSSAGLRSLRDVAIKAWLSVLSLIWLTATTPAPELLRGLRALRLPRALIQQLSLLLRYVPLTIEEAASLRRASEVRSCGTPMPILRRFRALGGIVGTLLIRTYERGERIYGAMLARGFTGEMPGAVRLGIDRWDAAFAASLLTLLVVVEVVAR